VYDDIFKRNKEVKQMDDVLVRAIIVEKLKMKSAVQDVEPKELDER
jgi:hypothetical protein